MNPIADAGTSADTVTSGAGGPEGPGSAIRHQKHLLNSRTGPGQVREGSDQDHIDLHSVPGAVARSRQMNNTRR